MKELTSLYEVFLSCSGVCTDTRKISNNCLFFALKGENFNGNSFAKEALQLGAKHVVIDEPVDGLADSSQATQVDDVLKCLQALSLFHRRQLTIPIIGITGTNGKTTTKELIDAVLSSKYRTYATAGNFNNHIGVPLTLLAIDKEVEIAVVEMGANKQGDIAELCEMAEPDYGIITNIGQAHLEGFGSVETILATKTELYNSLRKRDKVAFVNQNDDKLMLAAQGITTYTYGEEGSGAACQASLSKEYPTIELAWSSSNGVLPITTQLFGAYNFQNVLAAICIGQYFEVDPKGIQQALLSYAPSNHRSEWKKTDRNELILDAYNANPTSMEQAINSFKKVDAHHKVAILGDMFELGQEAPSAHQKVIEQALDAHLDELILVGQNFQRCEGASAALCFEDSDATIQYLQDHPVEGATVLIKGSRGMQLERLADVL